MFTKRLQAAHKCLVNSYKFHHTQYAGKGGENETYVTTLVS